MDMFQMHEGTFRICLGFVIHSLGNFLSSTYFIDLFSFVCFVNGLL
jgi:hypothetical protein